MDSVLLDTNIVSFLLKGDTRASLYEPHLEGRRLAISFMTVAELFQWAAVRKWGTVRMQQLEANLKSYIIVPFDVVLCRLWGEIRAARRAAGRPISSQDAWIAATALQHGIPLITHNPDDFDLLQELQLVTAE